MVVTTGDWDLYESNYGKANKKKIIYFLTFDDCNENSILSCITKARENARSVRPEITKELWEQINDLYFRIQEGAEKKIWVKNDPKKFF